MRRFRSSGHHAFWPQDLSICEERFLDPDHVAGSRNLTDAYLLALAVRHGGRLVTFDRDIPLRAAPAATPEHLLVLST